MFKYRVCKRIQIACWFYSSGKDESVLSNFKMYHLQEKYVDVWMDDQINTALRTGSMFDAIVTDRKWHSKRRRFTYK